MRYFPEQKKVHTADSTALTVKEEQSRRSNKITLVKPYSNIISSSPSSHHVRLLHPPSPNPQNTSPLSYYPSIHSTTQPTHSSIHHLLHNPAIHTSSASQNPPLPISAISQQHTSTTPPESFLHPIPQPLHPTSPVRHPRKTTPTPFLFLLIPVSYHARFFPAWEVDMGLRRGGEVRWVACDVGSFRYWGGGFMMGE